MSQIRTQLTELAIEGLIVHEVPRPSKGSAVEPVLSDVPSPLPTEVRTFFEEKTGEALGARAFDVVFDAETKSPVPALIRQTIAGDMDFVEMSRRAAAVLVSSHTSATSAGLLTVARCALGGSPGLLLLKLEKEEGVRVEKVGGKGHSTLSVEHIRTLMLTNKTRVFKVGLFARMGGKKANLSGLVCDVQQPRSSEAGIAHFFLESFLGCRLTQQPEVVTRDFFHVFEGFLVASVSDPEVQTNYRLALASELTSNEQTIDPKGFARKHLKQEHRKPMIDALELAKVPVSVFPKNTALINTRLEKLRLEFQHGIHVVATQEAVRERMKFKTLSSGELEVKIRDVLSRTR